MTLSKAVASHDMIGGIDWRQPATCLIPGMLALAITGSLSHAGEASAQGLSPVEVGSRRAEKVDFEPFAAFPAGAGLARLVGDPTSPGPYVVRVKVPDGVRLMPHIHPEDRVYTVISGVFYIGFGRAFDAGKLMAYAPGSVVVLPHDTPHFHLAMSGEYVTQVTGTGPLGIEYINERDDPRQIAGRSAAGAP